MCVIVISTMRVATGAGIYRGGRKMITSFKNNLGSFAVDNCMGYGDRYAEVGRAIESALYELQFSEDELAVAKEAELHGGYDSPLHNRFDWAIINARREFKKDWYNPNGEDGFTAYFIF